MEGGWTDERKRDRQKGGINRVRDRPREVRMNGEE